MTGGRVVMCPVEDCLLECWGDNEKVFVAKEALIGVGVEIADFVEQVVN